MAKIIINCEKRLAEKHVCWMVEKDSFKSIRLIEMVLVKYEHPDSEGQAYIEQLESNLIKTVDRLSREAGVLLLLEANEKAVTYAQEKVPTEDRE